jgi:hypothetical protein
MAWFQSPCHSWCRVHLFDSRRSFHRTPLRLGTEALPDEVYRSLVVAGLLMLRRSE